jgi:3-hydroxybutyryl-CoA dehydrogenase
VTSLAQVAGGADVAVEAMPERLELKRSVPAAAEALAPALLATNTSSIPIRALAAGLADPSRFCGLHNGVASAADIDKAMVLGYRHPMGRWS